MPAGVAWAEYLKFTSCALLSMLAGSQLVHMYYNPLKDLDKYIENEAEEVEKTTGIKLKEKIVLIKDSASNNSAAT